MIRSGALAAIKRHAELSASVVALLLALWWLWRGVTGGLPVFVFLALLIGVPALFVLRGAVQRFAFRRGTIEPGVVLLDERRLGFFGPEEGGFLETGALVRVELEAGPEPVWHLWDDTGATLAIPAGASGADQLYGLFAALPGMDLGHARSVLQDATRGRRPIWAAEDGTGRIGRS